MQAVLLNNGILLLHIPARLSHITCLKFAKFNSLITLSIATRSHVFIFVVKYVIFNARTGSLNKMNYDASSTIM